MFTAFESALKKYNKNYLLLKGDKETRLKNAVEEIDKLILKKKNLYSFSNSLQDTEMYSENENS